MTSSSVLSSEFSPSPGHVFPGGRVDGQIIEGTPRSLDNPITGDEYAQVGWVDSDTAVQAVNASARARTVWSRTTGRERATALRDMAASLREYADFFADLIMIETGKRRQEAFGEAYFSARYFDWFAEAATMLTDQHLVNENRRFVVNRHPVGVVAAISPWNFPLSIPARKLAAALGAGCPVVMKPSELTPLSSLALTELCERYLPEGVVNTVNGSGETLTAALMDHSDTAAVTFTGSTKVGTLVASRAVQSMTRPTLELGGKAPFIVCADADLDVALDALLVAKFRNNGASCIAANNVWIHRNHYDSVVSKLADHIASMRVGDPNDPNVDLGPMLRPEHTTRLNMLLEEARSASCPVTVGKVPESAGYFFPPALVETSSDVSLWREEIFGPVLALRSFEDEGEIVDDSNSSNFGLGGYVVSHDIQHAMDLAGKLRIGIVGINNGAPNTPEVPFGGFGLSGLGREGGISGLLEFTEEQTISIAR